MNDWNRETADIWWTKYAGLHLFVYRMPTPGLRLTLWRWSAWRGDVEIHVAMVALSTPEETADAAKQYADDRRYCA